jgi:hypothetical protein
MDGGNEQKDAIKFRFKTGVCDRNTSVGATGLWE